MIITHQFKFEPSDPHWQRDIDEAFNRLSNFASELRYRELSSPRTQGKAFNKIVTNGEFTMADWLTLYEYGKEVVQRAIMGAKLHPTEIAESIDQAALHLRDVLNDFDSFLRIAS